MSIKNKADQAGQAYIVCGVKRQPLPGLFRSMSKGR